MVFDNERRALTRQALTATTFVEIVDTLVDDFDVIEVLTLLTSRSVESVSDRRRTPPPPPAVTKKA